MLGRNAIDKAIAKGTLKFDGCLRGDDLLLSLGGPLLTFEPIGKAVDPYDGKSVQSLYGRLLVDWKKFILRPQQLVLAQVRERIELNPRTIGLIGALSHAARLGLSTQLNSTKVNASFHGMITLELWNAGPRPLILRIRAFSHSHRR